MYKIFKIGLLVLMLGFYACYFGEELMSEWKSFLIVIFATYGGMMSFFNNRDLNLLTRRVNYMKEVLIKKGVAGEHELTLALRNIKMHDED
jgi:hypothetical protein